MQAFRDDRRLVCELADQFLVIADELSASCDTTDALRRLVLLARTVVPGCDWASVTQVGTPKFTTVAVTDGLIRHVEQLQRDLDEGPCIDAAEQDGRYVADDLTGPTAWPRFAGQTVIQTPVRSLLSVTVHPLPRRAALNLYGRNPNVFDDTGVGIATAFAAQARVLLMFIQAADSTVNLSQALMTSRLVGTATDIVMKADRTTADQAFRRLVRASTDLDRHLSDVATEVTGTGRPPPVRM